MKKTLILLAATVIASVSAFAQTFADYSISVENTTWQSIAATGTRLTQVSNTYTQTIQLPFDLEFGGATVAQGQNVKISGRGRINFGTYGAYNYAHTHWNSPSGEFAIIPFFVEMSEMASGGQCYYLVRNDDRGGQELVVEWNHLRRYGATGDNVSYQVSIHSNGDIGVCYGPMTLQAGYWDTVFTFALVHDNAADRILTIGSWSTDSTIVTANPSQIGSSPLMTGTPQEGLELTFVRPLPPCPHPMHLVASEVWQQGATLRWTGNGVAGAQYLVQYSTTDFTPVSPSVMSHTATDTTYIISGLLEDQQYFVYVRSDCGPDTSRWEGVQFQTSCSPILHTDLPYTQQFESAASVTCWRKLGTVNWSSQQNVGGTIIRFANLFDSNSVAIMPPVDYVNDLQVSFRVTGGPVMVGVMDDPSDISSFAPIHECWANAASWSEYTVRLSRYDGSGQYVAFLAWPNQYGVAGCRLDDVVLEHITGCIAPEMLHTSHVSATTADIQWDDYDSVGLYRVSWTDGITSDSISVTTQYATLTPLTPEMQYTVSVRNVCDSATVGPAATVTFTTYATCVKPLAVTVDSVTRLTAHVSWTDPNPAGTYRIAVMTSPGHDTVLVDTVVGTTEYLITGLASVRRYRVDVSQLCSGVWTDAEWETFDNVYSCAPPQDITVDTVLTTSAIIRIADSLCTTHRVVLLAGTCADTFYVADSVVTVTGLQPATQYTVAAATLCSDSTLSDFVSATFATPCSVVTHADLPYVEDFENTIAGSVNTLSPCWTFRSFAPSNYTGMYRPDDGQYFGAAGHSLYVLAQQPDWPFFIAMPEVDSLDDLMLNLWVYCNRAGDSKIDFGIMSDPSDTTTFQMVDTYIPAVARQWVEVAVPFRGHGSAGHYPAMRVGVASGTSGAPFFLDDVTLTYNLSCERPDSLSVLSITDTSALLAIHPATDADSDAMAYQVVVTSPYGDDTLIVTDTLVNLGGLHPATDYGVSVRSLCSEGGITLATSMSFTTPCGVYPLPWSEGFENSQIFSMPRCWQLADTLANSIDVRTTPIVAHGGVRMLHAGFSTAGSYVSFLTPELAATDAPVLLSYYARAFEIERFSDTTFVQLRVSLVSATGDTAILFADKVLLPDWTPCQHVVPQGLMASGGRFLFYASHLVYSSYSPAYLQLDDMDVSVACLPVDSLEVEAVDTVPTGFSASWQPQGNEAEWTVHLWSDAGDTTFIVAVPYAVLPTVPETDYCLAVEPLCTPLSVVPDSVEVDTICFTTPAVPTPISQVESGVWKVAIYPNPAYGDVTVTTVYPGLLTVLDLTGRVVVPSTRVDSSLLIPRSSLPKGTCFVRLVTASGTIVAKLVVR